jgi:N utilization substance protein A
VLSRTRPHLVARLFEQEIPEITDGVIEVKAMAREPGYRTKVAVSSTDQRVDCVGACVGVRGNRIKNIVDELAGERIDIVRYSDDMQVLIPNALQPAEVEEVILCQMLGRAIVLVREDQLSLAIGRRGQNVRLASKLCGWDIEIMTREELDEQLEQAVMGFESLEGVSEELADRLVGEGFLTYDDLSVIEPDDLMEMGELPEEEVNHIIAQAETRAEEAERAAAEERQRQREQERAESAMARAAAASAQPEPAAADEGTAATEATGDETEQAQAAQEPTSGEEPAEQAGTEAPVVEEETFESEPAPEEAVDAPLAEETLDEGLEATAVDDASKPSQDALDPTPADPPEEQPT